MAELESLLFRKTRGDLFDMPAYRDVLFLYSLARDLLGREPMDRADVDVLLKIMKALKRPVMIQYVVLSRFMGGVVWFKKVGPVLVEACQGSLRSRQ